METMIATEPKRQVILTLPEQFRPINDEYRPFPLVERRDNLLQKIEVPAVVKAMNLPRNKRILLIGCGTGAALVPLAELCHPRRLVGIDINTCLLGEAESRLKQHGIHAELWQEDVRAMPFADGSFDIIIDFGTCYHINRRVYALKEISRVLAAGGRFVYETRFNQMLSHPVRAYGKRIPWRLAPDLALQRAVLMWATRVKR